MSGSCNPQSGGGRHPGVPPQRPSFSLALAGLLIWSCSGWASQQVVVSGPDEDDLLMIADHQLPGGDRADIYWPRMATEIGEGNENGLPLIAFLPGAFVDKAQYSGVAREIASRGFVFVVPDPAMFVTVNHVNDVHQAMVRADQNPDSPLFEVIDTERMGVGGHSLGGAVAIHALTGTCVGQICTTDPPEAYAPPAALRAVAVYGANLVDGGEVAELDGRPIEIMLLQGSQDGIARPSEATQTYPALAKARALIEIPGLNHYAICNDDNPPGAKQDPLSPDPALSQGDANRIVAFWLANWFEDRLRSTP